MLVESRKKNTMKKDSKNLPTDRCMICGWEGTSNELIEGSKTDPSLCPICFSSDLEDIEHNPYKDDDDITNDDDGSIFA